LLVPRDVDDVLEVPVVVVVELGNRPTDEVVPLCLAQRRESACVGAPQVRGEEDARLVRPVLRLHLSIGRLHFHVKQVACEIGDRLGRQMIAVALL